MGHFKVTPHFEAPIERVFALSVDPLRIPEWAPSIFEVKDATPGPMTLGSTYTAVTKLLGRHLDIRYEITEIDSPRLLTAVGTASNGGRVLLRTRLTPAASGTDAELEVDYDLPIGFLGEIADKLFVEQAMERDMRHGVENFRSIVEARIPLTI
jgi:uncharacterized protein YndB with AHSA1/START domain